MDREQLLLKNALVFEDGHRRRTEHILKVYSLTRMIAITEQVSDKELKIASAAAILHDIPIKKCKELFGDACQRNQNMLAPDIVKAMMGEAGYEEDEIHHVLELVMNHHNYHEISSHLLRILMEADLLVNYMEDREHVDPSKTEFVFTDAYARELRKLMVR